ncbi:ribonuclease HII [bacterium]|nr:ribonuclease HII [candidate division CSSED10-310 bacterium]
MITDTLFFEKKATQDGFRYIAGLDEAGRGALCGPVVAAAVILPDKDLPSGIKDSKLLKPKERLDLYPQIFKSALSVGVGLSRAAEIDRINILNATKLAMYRACLKLSVSPDLLLLDAITIEALPLPQIAIIKGDQRSLSIAAASIVAKVVRDRIMNTWHKHFPMYGFLNNKGYGTKEHRDALRTYGPTAIHRKTFKQVFDCWTLFGEI